MKLSHYVSLCLIFALVYLQVYSFARATYNGISEYKAEIRHLREGLAQKRMEARIQEEHFLEFRQHVATLMPDVLKQKGIGEEGYPLRSLASTISKNENLAIQKTLAKTVFEKGKEFYRKGEFNRANRAFRVVIENYGFSPYVVESYFLMAEGYFQSDQFEECTSLVQRMIELFPSHELTGFAMVRLGRIFEMQSRTEEAVDIYRTVLRSFPQKDVAAQAKDSLRGMDL